MGRVGGYNHLKQLGVGSTIAGQIIVGALGGGLFGFVYAPQSGASRHRVTIAVFVLLPILVLRSSLWPVLGTSYRGLPIGPARFVTLIGFALCVLRFRAGAGARLSISHRAARSARHE